MTTQLVKKSLFIPCFLLCNIHYQLINLKEKGHNSENDEMKDLVDNQMYVNSYQNDTGDMKHMQNKGAADQNAHSELAQIEAATEPNIGESGQYQQYYEAPIEARPLHLTIREVGSSSDRGSKRKAQAHDIVDQVHLVNKKLKVNGVERVGEPPQ